MTTEENILNTTYELLLEKRSLNISMSEISKKSKTSPGTIYYHFENKDKLIKTAVTKYVINEYFNQISFIQNMQGTTYEKIKYCLYLPLNFKKNSPIPQDDLGKFLQLILESNEKYPDIIEGYSKYRNSFSPVLLNIIEEGIQNDQLRDNINVERLNDILKKEINGLFFTLFLDNVNDFQTLTDYTLELFWNFIKK